MMDIVIDLILASSVIPAALFFISYLRSRWTATLPGKASMALTASIVIVLMIPLWRELTGERAADWFRLLAFILIVSALWFQFVALLIVQYHREEREEQARRDDASV